ncbi:hypothetical protein ACWGRK_02230 [Saccharomonospora azurea]|uniref:Uncharacterized protein n=1 Tax=Saccharomonospora azurea NA-128 TaxID=882081 RepID=H8GCH0_9PSEU|nr:hypothetical protein [Saccharomonospora azurea]EHY89778.1 hypothetical protein SacazDRAFT_02891 [Saccharomonospora azurea NA-128]
MRWELRKGERLVGTLTYEGSDMFWHACRFEPGPAWPEFAPLFDALNSATDRGDDDALHDADQAINAAGLVLDPGTGEPPVTDFLVSIEGEAAGVRFG